MIELNKIYNEDCLEGMKRIDDKSIDAIICDLPYGTTRNAWDSVIPFNKLWEQYERVIKDNGAIVLFAQMPFAAALVSSNYKMFRYEWVWQKSRKTGFLNANRTPLRCHENVYIFSKKPTLYNPQMTLAKRTIISHKAGENGNNYGFCNARTVDNKGKAYPVDVINFKSEPSPFHPTQKPVELIRYFIRTYTNSGGVILDNCIGSGTTAVAAILEGRNYIGFELEKKYYDKACERVAKELSIVV